jgi:hypothetical protein
VATDIIIQRWQDQRVIETICSKPLPNSDLLSEAVPRNKWELDLNGKPRPPYEKAFVVYFLDLDSAERSTFINSTVGSAIAVSTLKDKVYWMRKMRGAGVVPQVEFTWAPMGTRFGIKKRPDFKVLNWVDFTPGGSTLPPASGPKQLPPLQPKQVENPSVEEDLDDQIPPL